jgi:hypothetical protein
MQLDVPGLRRNTYLFFAVLCTVAVVLLCYGFAPVDQATKARALTRSFIVFFVAAVFLGVRLRYLRVVEILRDGPPKSTE